MRVLFPSPWCGREGNRYGLTPLWRVESCRIGAENESSSFQAQQAGGVIQTFTASGALRAAPQRPAGESGQWQKTLILP
jgi:hypothetical protein